MTLSIVVGQSSSTPTNTASYATYLRQFVDKPEIVGFAKQRPKYGDGALEGTKKLLQQKRKK
jgi:hypothetical protein